MRERIILTIVCILGSLLVAGAAWESLDKSNVFWITFGIIETLALCTYNYLENGICWFWGMDHTTRKRKEFEKRFKNKRF